MEINDMKMEINDLTEGESLAYTEGFTLGMERVLILWATRTTSVESCLPVIPAGFAEPNGDAYPDYLRGYRDGLMHGTSVYSSVGLAWSGAKIEDVELPIPVADSKGDTG